MGNLLKTFKVDLCGSIWPSGRGSLQSVCISDIDGTMKLIMDVVI